MRPESTTTAAAALVRTAKERVVERQTTQLSPRIWPGRPPGVSRRMAAALRATVRAEGPEAALAVWDSTLNGTYPRPPRLQRYAPHSRDSSYHDSRESGGLSKRSASTWTVQVGEVPVSYVTHESWDKQPRPERGQPLGSVDEPFRGCTLEERHPDEPKATYSQAELGSLCPVCGTLIIHWETHVAGQLHYDNTHTEEKAAGARSRVAAMVSGSSSSAMPTQTDVVAALRVLQATRPDIIASSLRLALPQQALHQSLMQNASSSPAMPPPHYPRRSRWDPEDNNGNTYLPSGSSRMQSRPFVKREELADSRSRPRDAHSAGYSSGRSQPSGYWR